MPPSELTPAKEDGPELRLATKRQVEAVLVGYKPPKGAPQTIPAQDQIHLGFLESREEAVATAESEYAKRKLGDPPYRPELCQLFLREVVQIFPPPADELAPEQGKSFPDEEISGWEIIDLAYTTPFWRHLRTA